MSNLFDSLANSIQKFSSKFSNYAKKYYLDVLVRGEKIGSRGKIQIEIEKLKWELRQKYIEIGKHVSNKKINESITDYSHDQNFIRLISEINKINLYIDDYKKKTKHLGY